MNQMNRIGYRLLYFTKPDLTHFVRDYFATYLKTRAKCLERFLNDTYTE